MNATSGNTFWKLATVARRPSNLPDKTFGAPGKSLIFFENDLKLTYVYFRGLYLL
jgi:hypothetical protein